MSQYLRGDEVTSSVKVRKKKKGMLNGKGAESVSGERWVHT